MKLLLGFVLNLLLLPTLALAQGTQVNPPGVKWGAAGIQTPAPVQNLGYDSSTGAPCIVGSTATCQLAVSASGGSTAVTGGAFGTVSDSAWSGTGDSTAIAVLKAIYNNLAATVLGAGTGGTAIRTIAASDSPAITFASQYPATATPLTASATGTTAATVATLAATSGKTTYICGFSISSDATAGLAGAATVAGTITGTLNYIQGVAAAPAVSILNQNFAPCIPASATNTTIVITSAAAGIGGGTAVTAWGFQL